MPLDGILRPMDKQEFLRSFEELLELPPSTLNGSELLEGLEQWDSMAGLGFIALVDEKCGVVLANSDIVRCSTVDDLGRLAGIQG